MSGAKMEIALRHAPLALFLATLCLAGFSPVSLPAQGTVVGWVEKVHIDALDSVFKAKLDTGATTASIDATIIKETSASEDPTLPGDGEVVFSITDDTGKERTLQRTILRHVRIKTKNGGYVRRPVIKMTLCLAGKKITDEVNLAERENFIYPVLVGRNMLSKAGLLIDAGRTFVSSETCGK